MYKKKEKINPSVIWITGLSGSGKTSTSKKLYEYMQKKYYKIKWLDGDKIRKKLKIPRNNNSFSLNYRIKLGKKYSKIARSFEKKGYFVIISVMALSKKVLKFNRKNIRDYHEVFINVPKSELKRRDPKKIYKRFFNKEIRNVVGFDLPYYIPINANLKINWKKNMTKQKIFLKILNYLNLNVLKKEKKIDKITATITS